MKFIVCMFVFLIVASQAKSQAYQKLTAAISDAQKKVQAIHHYPKSSDGRGKCHFVEVTAITISGNSITIVEEWTNWAGSKAKTTLTGQLAGDIASGNWKSDYSGGSWTYNFSTNTGTWNKSNSSFDKFEEFQKLEFKVIGNDAVKDDFFPCNIQN